MNLLGPAARQAVSDAEDQVGPVPFLAVLSGWCEAVNDERDLTPVRRNVVTLTARLTAHLPWICEQPWVTDFEAEIRDLLRVVQGITMTRPRRVPLPGVRCPSCTGLTLVREDHSGWAAECGHCPAVKLDQRDYEDLVKAQACRVPGAAKS
ncbi:hypothetical protein ACFWB2_14600 [Streptomyces virginiae]|uniref:hypothetical protein n=1 Tax=Streptomyces virginiae TaxID=1961 RepID=UPI0036BCC07E